MLLLYLLLKMSSENVFRKSILGGLIRLRKEHRLNQAEFAKILGLSQQRLSEIERNDGSITAEQLVSLLQHFNLPLSYFVTVERQDEELTLQNALARLGAKHLRESPNILVPEKWEQPDQVIFEALYLHPSSRLVPALAPVFVANIHRINFKKLAKLFFDFGFVSRLLWVEESTLQAIHHRLEEPILPRRLKSSYRHAQTALTAAIFHQIHFRESVFEKDPPLDSQDDFLDPDIISDKSREIAKKERDDLALKWQIVTRIKQKDFDEALSNSEAYV